MIHIDTVEMCSGLLSHTAYMYECMVQTQHTPFFHLWAWRNAAIDCAFLSRTSAHTVHLVPVCFITSDWSITATVRETKPERPLQFWTVIWLKCIHLAGADVVRRCTERLITTASPSVLLVDEIQSDLAKWKLKKKKKKAP